MIFTAQVFREAIRRFARQRNGIGFACSFALSLFRKGRQQTAAMIREYQSSRINVRDLPELKLTKKKKQEQQERVFSQRILFSILVPLYNTPEKMLREMIRSVQEQTYQDWELCLADGSDPEHSYVESLCREYMTQDNRICYRKRSKNDGIAENTNTCVGMAKGDYLVLLDHDDLLVPSALYENRKAIEEENADFLYSDEAVFLSPDPDKILLAHLKPDYAPDDLLSNNYICHLVVFRSNLLEKTGMLRSAYNGSQDYDLILRLTEFAEKIVHIPKVLYLWRSHADSAASGTSVKPYTVEAGRRAVRDFLKDRRGTVAEVTDAGIAPCMYRVLYPINGTPPVSVISTGNPDEATTQQWLKTLKEQTSYQNTEWLFTAGEGNDSVCLNRAAEKANGDYLLFLKNGLVPGGSDWIENMLMLAQRKQTAAVGARIVFSNGLIHHAGIILGFGKNRIAGRRFYMYPTESGACMGRLNIVGNVSAVSAECLMIRRGVFEEIGGFQSEYKHSLYDVDLCLKLKAKGYRNVYTPWPEMRDGPAMPRSGIEYGSENPGYREDAKQFRERWKEELKNSDPYYHPKFSRERMIFRPRG